MHPTATSPPPPIDATSTVLFSKVKLTLLVVLLRNTLNSIDRLTASFPSRMRIVELTTLRITPDTAEPEVATASSTTRNR